MPRRINNNLTQRTLGGQQSGSGSRIDPEILKQVAERVYAMLLNELNLEVERLGYRKSGLKGLGGGHR